MAKRSAPTLSLIPENNNDIYPPLKKMRLSNTDSPKNPILNHLETKINIIEKNILNIENKYETIYKRLIQTENELDRITSNLQQELDDCVDNVKRLNPQYPIKNDFYMDYIN